MLSDTPRPQLDLADDEVARLRNACNSRLEVTQGHVWVTIDGDRNDIVLSAGESLLIDSRDAVMVSALRGAASLRLRANVAANRCRQSAAQRGTSPSRLRQLLAGISLSSVAVA